MAIRTEAVLAKSAFAAFLVCVSGCVERRLTINTQPQGALVELNDEQIGVSPVTVSFNWYGDYTVKVSKEGYATLQTHQEIKAPLHDQVPFDFFAQVLWPGRIADSYEWTFTLSPKILPSRDEVIQKAEDLKGQMD